MLIIKLFNSSIFTCICSFVHCLNISIKHNKKPPVGQSLGRFFERLCSALDVDRVRALWRLFHVEGDGVAFAKFVKAYADERVAVEKEIFFLTFNGNESKTLVGLFLDYTIHSMYE